MASRQKEFYGRVYNDARSAGLSDAQARLAASQASLETGYGKSAVGNNYFGVKAGSSWKGPVSNAGTWENVNGKNVNTRANFRAYENPFSSLLDWSKTLNRNFPSSYVADDFDTAVSGLNDGRFGSYATDPNYGSKLRSIDRNNYGPQLGIMSVIDPPTPSPRPSEDPFSALLSPVSYQAPSFPATSAAVQREALPDVTPVSFDNSRFGAPAKTFDQSRFGAPSPAASSYFDYSGLLSDPQPDTFDAGRMPQAAPVATTPQQLQRGLLDQQLNAGILPDLMAPATNWPGQVAPAAAPMAPAAPAAAAYTDPMISTEPASINTASVQAPGPSWASSGLMAPAEMEQVQQQQGLLGGQLQHSTPEQMQAMAAQTAKGMQNRSLGGGLLGGLLGGLTLGPIGAIAGGLLGRNVAKNSFFPDAPKPSANSRNDKNLNDYGKSVSSSSGQFSRAMASGGKGLY
ncbi:glycoside hydrolase family 73 protein [Rhizobium leguminosarum]